VRKFLWRGILFVVQVALVLGVGFLCLDRLMGSIIHTRKEIAVPALTGKTMYQALESLAPLGLGIIQEGQEHNPDIAVGTIVKQYPPGGSTTREGSIVRAVISLGSEKISTPELIGLPLRKAEIELKLAQLSLGETQERYSLEQPRSYVLEQDPKPLTLTEKGEMVHVVISQGEPPASMLIVPDFVNQDVTRVSQWSQSNRIELKIIENWTASAADGTVLSQSIKPDTLWKKSDLENLKPILELTVARQSSGNNQKYINYTFPATPARTRELSIKTISANGEEEVAKIHGNPNQTVKIPISSGNASLKRVRVYLDGVFTEERDLK